MDRKEPRLVLAVTTQKAMELCMMEGVSVFCIENPLYSQLYPVFSKELFSDYRLEVFDEQQVAMMTKIKGENAFDESKYEPYYLPFQWENWHS